MKIINLVLAFVFSSITVQAANLIDLQEQALVNREVVQRHIVSVEKSRTNENLARSSLYPSLDLAYTATWLDGFNALEDRENRFASGTISWNIFAGFRDKYNIKSAQLLREAENYRLQGIKQDIKLAVALRYLAIYDRQASLKVATDSATTLAKLHEDAINRFEVGLIQKSEMLKFKIDLDNAVINSKKAQAEVDKSIALLEREIGAKIENLQFDFKEFNDQPTLLDEETHQKKMLNNRSEIKLLEETLKAAMMKIKVERASYYPSVDLAGIYRKYDDSTRATIDNEDDDEVRTQIILSMNIFDGFNKKSRIGAATLEEQALRHDLAETRLDFKVQLRNLFLDYNVSIDNVVVAASSIEQAEENLRVNRLVYEEGVSTESELLDAIANLSRAKSNFVAAKSEGFARYFQIVRSVEGL